MWNCHRKNFFLSLNHIYTTASINRISFVHSTTPRSSIAMATAMQSLPAVPVKHQDFVKYVQSNQDKPIEELVQPYNEYDAVMRKAFAQEPSNPTLQDNHINLVPLYDENGSSNVQVRARNLDSESPELKEKYLVPLKDQDRRPTGSPAVVPSLEEFRKNFTIFSEGSLSDMDWSNVVVAGSAVLTSLLPVPEKYRGSKRSLREYYHEKFAPASDVDLFLYGLTDEQAVEKIQQIESSIKNAILWETTTIRTKNTITIASQYPTRHVQIVLRIYKSVAEVLTGFDVDCSCAAYDGKQIYLSPRALAACITQVNRIDLTRRSPSYENRLSKYSHRGFEVFWPPLDRSKIDPTIFERSFARTVGLARLLVLEKLPKSGDRDRYLMQRREERGRPLPNTFARRMRQLPGNIKDQWDDETPDWQEQDEISDYHTFSIPYGPSYHSRKIEKLLYTKDILLNAEWNRSNKRDVKLHRHPAFIGDVEHVIHDCCGYCPEPVTQEEKEVAEEDSKTFISGDVAFIKDDPGRQEIGSFNPITDTDWAEMAYVGNTEGLCQAIVDHDLAGVKEWLAQENADPNIRDYTGRTPLQLASLTSTPEIAQCLVDHGARLVSRMADGKTALHLAAARGNVDIVRILLTKSDQNEEQEAKKEDLQKGDPEQEKDKAEEKPAQEPAENLEDEEDDDFEDIDDLDDASSRTSGSYVKVGDDTNLPEAENELEPDIYDINAVSWDSHTSPLHLAILNGHVDVVEELVSSFGADVLLPIKLVDDNNSPTAAILTLVLALQLPLEKAKAMTEKLLQLGASPSQADLKHNTPLHYLAVSKYIDLLATYTHHDEPAVKRAINHLAFAGYSWVPRPYSAFVAAVNGKNVIGALKMLEAGAEPSFEFNHFVKSAKAVSYTVQSNSSEENETFFRQEITQPIILAVKKELPHTIMDILAHGGDPNTLTPDGYRMVDLEDYRDFDTGKSLLECVRGKLSSLRGYKGENLYSSPPRPLEPEDSVYLRGIEKGTYAMWSAKEQVKDARDEYARALKEHERRVSDTKNRKGTDLKVAAINDLIKKFEELEAALLEKGAKTLLELHPGIEGPKEDEEKEEKEEELKKDRWKVTFSFKVPDLTDVRRNGYLKLFNAAFHGDLATIKALTLSMWGPNNEEHPLQIAVTDRNGFSPFSLAALRGHFSVAKATLEIVRAQYKPKEPKGHTRYQINEESYIGNVGLQDEDLGIYSEIIDDQFTVENIGEVATQVECSTTPLEVLNWECAARLFIEQDHITDEKRRDFELALPFSRPSMLSLGARRSGEPGMPYHLVDYAVWTDNIPLLVFLLNLGQELTNRDTEAESTIYTLSENSFLLAIIMGRVGCLEELIKRTGAGLPIDELAKNSGVESNEKPKFYQGLTIRGKKRADWSSYFRMRRLMEEGSPLLIAAFYGKLESTKWFLGKEPGQLYTAFTKTYEHDKRLKRLEQSANGVEGSLKNWLGTRNGLVLHCAVMAKPSEESEQLVKYLVEHYPACLETKSLGGHTPVALAFALQRTNIAKILIDAGADQTTRDCNGNNLIHLLLGDIQRSPRATVEGTKFLLGLLDSRLVPSLLTERSSEDPGSLTPISRWIHLIYRLDLHTYSSRENEETDNELGILRVLLDFAESTGQKHLELLDGAGNTPLHNAVKGHLPRNLELMIERRPDLLHRESATGNTPFEMAVDAWVDQVTKNPPTIPTEDSPSWSDGSKHEYKDLIYGSPESFAEAKEKDPRTVEQIVCDLCRAHSQPGGQKRKLVTLYEANEVAKRLAARTKASPIQDEYSKPETDEVQTWWVSVRD